MAGRDYKDKIARAKAEGTNTGRDRVGGLTDVLGQSYRLLPIIELKEFKGFFEDLNLRLWQRIFFSTLGLAGWILGGVLVLAVSGLTQNP